MTEPNEIIIKTGNMPQSYGFRDDMDIYDGFPSKLYDLIKKFHCHCTDGITKTDIDFLTTDIAFYANDAFLAGQISKEQCDLIGYLYARQNIILMDGGQESQITLTIKEIDPFAKNHKDLKVYVSTVLPTCRTKRPSNRQVKVYNKIIRKRVKHYKVIGTYKAVRHTKNYKKHTGDGVHYDAKIYKKAFQTIMKSIRKR